jgi:hypothetical protein
MPGSVLSRHRRGLCRHRLVTSSHSGARRRRGVDRLHSSVYARVAWTQQVAPHGVAIGDRGRPGHLFTLWVAAWPRTLPPQSAGALVMVRGRDVSVPAHNTSTVSIGMVTSRTADGGA